MEGGEEDVLLVLLGDRTDREGGEGDILLAFLGESASREGGEGYILLDLLAERAGREGDILLVEPYWVIGRAGRVVRETYY